MHFIYYVLIVVGLIIIWSAWGYFSSQIEHTPYTVIESKGKYEIRLYPAHIVAQTVVKGPYEQALREGFGILAGYVFGGNTKKERIAMTAPVVESNATSEQIAMTAPVVATVEGNSHTISFGMPASYTLETLPMPADARIEIVMVPERKVAIIRFPWMRTESRVESKKRELMDALTKDGVSVEGEPQYAGYDAPWTPPWMMRNEVMVEIK
jgi:hypothetical protein